MNQTTRISATRAIGGLMATLLLAGLLWPAIGSAEIIDRIVARINDEIITQYELEKATTPFLLQRGMDPSALENPERRREIYGKVLEELINRKLIVDEAEKRNLSISDEQVDQWLAFTRNKQNMSKEQFQQVIQRYGMTYDEYRETVRQNLLKIRLVKVKLGRQVSVSDEEVEEIYRARFGPSGETERHVTIRHILFQPASDEPADAQKAKAEAEKVLAELEGGTSFEALAKEHSDGPSAKKGGFLGTFARGELNPAYEEVAFQLDEGENSGVVKTKFGFHIIRVDDVTEKAGTGSSERKKQIRQQLRQQKMQGQVDSWTEKLRNKAFVDIKVDYN